ncbi:MULTISPECIES: SMP-30/gluconolactonase/LRE family protein [Agrobacterium]|uniref:SMP-30/gluconolactonase/LRE family protein n=2 Tax=Pseudomonadota TaxID=1224 RepID=A0AAW9FH45_9HYPH|nr:MULTISPECIES: SMP-30/gluconolactonase/LRE family protein [Agrobacterium]MBN7806389.1 SMP-30/gluconolactonase/LRE family protein [Agrobacterium rosae]MBN7806668.1 SMP-30/gluconolactonase/LRE family protein [Agrobacterium rosae]MDX8304896.1 SMP-30/gluconolactonase/LRE family protein [Agrobacterium rosae]POO52705.1 IclR family transcriptional regulator [Agrobacterium rosae]SCX21969.1 L-arabinolactonase [Agrobacterium sp. DSM 25558]
MKPETPGGTAALAKGLTLLDMVADAPEPPRFAELLRASGLPKPTFARILRTLIAYGLVRQDAARGTYVLGQRFLEMSHKVWESFDLLSAATPELERLAAELGETVALCRLDGTMTQYLAERSPNGLSVRVEVGRRVPLHCTAPGKALLAFQDPAVGRALLDRLPLDPQTAKTITTLDALQADLTLTRARGYSISYEEHLPGVNSVAAPVIGRDNTPMGVLVALGPSSRLDTSIIHPAGRELIAAARRITGAAGAVAISSRPRPRSATGRPSADLTCILPWGAQLGESPVWHDGENALYWVDILHPAVHRFDPATGRNETCETGKLVSAVIPVRGGRLLVASQDGIEWLDFSSGRLTPFVSPEAGIADNRLNDAKCGPDGAIWVGSMRIDASKPTGALYRINANGAFERKEGGIIVSNGLGWSPDGKTFYFVDTVPGLIHAYDCDTVNGTLSNRREFARIPVADGRPDGLAVDVEGGVWCAIWDGWCVRRYLPDGKLDQVIDMPVPRPSSIAFGGPDLSTLFITSARTRLPASTLAEAPLSGGLFSCRPGTAGARISVFEG